MMGNKVNEDDSGAVVGYMDLTDFECELGAALGGNLIFPSVRDVRRNLKCADACGIVEVEVRFRRIMREPTGQHLARSNGKTEAV